MTLYLNENTNKDDMIQAFKNKTIFAVKLYPQGATTNSDKGVKNFTKYISIIKSNGD